jgi:dTDP-4-amino-4,6-dideoxygalactose transaminase
MKDDEMKFLDLAAQNGPLQEQLAAAFQRVTASNRFIMGPEVEAFEQEAAEYLGVEHAIGVSSGTDALLLSLMVLGVGPGDEVVTTPFTFISTAASIVRLGARPVFVDIDPFTYNLDVSRLEEAITERTRAILPVHLYGQPCDLRTLRGICAGRGIPMVEDAAQAIGAHVGGLRAGAVGAFGCFSFHPSKNLGAFGDAGLVTTRDALLADRARLIRHHGESTRYVYETIGGNFRLDALQAAILRVKLRYLDGWTEGRRRNADLYDSLFEEAALPQDLLLPPLRAADGHVYHQYVVRTPRRDALREHLLRNGFPCMVYYPHPLHLQCCFADLGYAAGSFPQAERAAQQVLALPVYAELERSRIRQVVECIVGFLKR